MDIVKQLCNPVLDFGDKVGLFLIPLLLITPIALIVMSFYSYRALKIVFPVLGLVVGYFAGSKFLGPVVEKFFEGTGFVTPALIGGVALALIFFLLCLKDRKLTLIVLGLSIGYLAVSYLVHLALRNMKFVQDILLNTEMDKAILFSTIISIVCALVMMYFCLKHFKFTYIFGVSTTAAILAFALPGIFIFKDSPNFEMGVLAFAGIGAFLGLILSWKQFKRFRYSFE